MYDFVLKDSEEIREIFDDIILKVEEEDFTVSVIVTTERFLILDFPRDVESFRIGREIKIPFKKEVILELNLEDISSIESDMEYDKYILNNASYFYLKGCDVRKLIEK